MMDNRQRKDMKDEADGLSRSSSSSTNHGRANNDCCCCCCCYRWMSSDVVIRCDLTKGGIDKREMS